MGGIEVAAALLGVITVILVVRRSVWNYPFGIAMVSLYFFVFRDARLYSDALLQIFFLIIQLYGWRAWVRSERIDDGVVVGWSSNRARIGWAVGTAAGILIWSTGMARFTDAVAPLADAAVAGMSVTAQSLQSLRRVESWIVWVAVDVLAIGVFAWRGLGVTAALYALFLLLAVVGFFEWQRKAKA